jgi:cysteinyl-tRNA synthetase
MSAEEVLHANMPYVYKPKEAVTNYKFTTANAVLKAKTTDATKLALLADFDRVLSLGLIEKAEARRAELASQQSAKTESGYTVTGEGDPAIDALVLARYEAKKAKNFAEADRIRDELKAQGIEIVDMKDGASWKRV